MKNRTLSPHLTIYKPQITSIVSIFHRISGSILSFSVILFWLCFCLDNCFSEYYIIYFFVSYFELYLFWLIAILLNFLAILICFHVINGFRHISWDSLFGLDIKNVNTTGLLVLTISTLFILVLLF